MKMRYVPLIMIFFLLQITVPAQEKGEIFSYTNNTGYSVDDVFLTAEIPDDGGLYLLFSDGKEIPSQIITEKGKRFAAFTLNFAAGETKLIEIKKGDFANRPAYKARTYAELSMKQTNVYYDGRFRGDRFVNVQKITVPAIHKDHDALFRYEGPGWESEKVGYRFYLDWRNATDIFGKKTNELILHTVGVHDTVAKDDSYHTMQPWGMDIYKVGSTLGLGSVGMWKNASVQRVSVTDSIWCEIAENGPVRSMVRTSYFGWNVSGSRNDLITDYSITAGSRLTYAVQKITPSQDTLVTGFPKAKRTSYFTEPGEGEWGYIALYGTQTLVNDHDNMGIAIFYKKSQSAAITEDSQSHVILFKPGQTEISYYFCAAWEQELSGIKSESEFREYLNQTLMLLNNPITIKLQ